VFTLGFERIFSETLFLGRCERPFVIVNLTARFFAGMGALPIIGHIWLRAASNVPFDFNDLPSKQLATDLQLLMRMFVLVKPFVEPDIRFGV
jgi:hypothetical protein